MSRRGVEEGGAILKTMGMPPEQPKEVYLTKPFIYMLIDCETNIPVFIGVMMDPSKK